MKHPCSTTTCRGDCPRYVYHLDFIHGKPAYSDVTVNSFANTYVNKGAAEAGEISS